MKKPKKAVPLPRTLLTYGSFCGGINTPQPRFRQSSDGLRRGTLPGGKKQVAAYALLVDAKNEQAKTFYLHDGFTVCNDDPMVLYLALGG